MLLLAGALILLACLLQAWIATRVPLWGDEFDTIAPALLPWRGDHSFWWQIHQYNAQPPGDNLVLRWYYHNGMLSWLRSFSEELFWRLPYLAVFAATGVVTFAGARRYSGSAFLAFFAMAVTLCSPGVLEYGNVVRFYAWLVFFVTASCWAFLRLEDSPRSARFYLVSLLFTLGVCFHVLLAAVGYFFLAYTVAWLLLKRERKPVALFFRLLFGALPFIMYKVELKHWLFIPPPNAHEPAWQQLARRGIGEAIMNRIVENLPLGMGAGSFYAIVAAVAIVAVLELTKKRYAQGFRALFLLNLLAAAPVALFITSAARAYELNGRQFLFEGPVVACAIVFLWCHLVERLSKGRVINTRIGRVRDLLAICVALAIASDSAAALSAFASTRGGTTPARVTYPFLDFRAAYRHVPGPRELVIVGSRPDRYGPFSDQGEYRAGIMYHYTHDLAPVFYSLKGGYDRWENPDPRLASRVESQPAQFDFLVLDHLDRAQELFPRLPWARLKCSTFHPGAPLSFCRI